MRDLKLLNINQLRGVPPKGIEANHYLTDEKDKSQRHNVDHCIPTGCSIISENGMVQDKIINSI